VASFGIGGTNTYAVLQSYKKVKNEINESKDQIEYYYYNVSSKYKIGIKKNLKQLLKYLKENENKNDNFLKNLSYTSFFKRDHFQYNLLIKYKSLEELIERIEKTLEEDNYDDIIEYNKIHENITYMIPGQGIDYLKYSKKLFKTNKVFKGSIMNLQKKFEINFEKYFESDDSIDINNLDIYLPLLFSIQISIHFILVDYNVLPNNVFGHSFGEIASSFISNNLTLDDAIKIIKARIKYLNILKLNNENNEKKMMISRISKKESEKYLNELNVKGEKIFIAAENSSNSITFSSKSNQKLVELSNLLEKDGFSYKFLDLSIAYHSDEFDSIEHDFIEELKLNLKNTKINFYSTVFGEKVEGEKLNGEYWYKNLRETVEFKKTASKLINDGETDVFIEVSPKMMFLNLLKENENKNKKYYVSLLEDNIDENMIKLYLYGYNKINLKKVLFKDTNFNLNENIDLPLYEWNYNNESKPNWEIKKDIYFEVKSNLMNTNILENEILRLSSEIEIIKDEEIEVLKKYGNEIEKICLKIIKNVLIELKWNEIKETKTKELFKKLKINEIYEKLLNRFLKILEKNKLIKIENEEIKEIQKFEKNENIKDEISKLKKEFKKYSIYELDILEKINENLLKILLKEIDPLTILFPDGDLDLVENIYENSIFSQIYNKRIQMFFKNYSENNKNIKVLEIGNYLFFKIKGGGTGNKLT
jgi:malonyl CoA-acyl carrier protein transacylase